MNKPEKKTISRTSYNWSEAEKWIEHKLGRKLRDYGSKWEGENPSSENPYWDYWHYICEMEEVSNPCYIYISSEWIDEGEAIEWQNEITQAFIDEFGDEEEFLVEW